MVFRDLANKRFHPKPVTWLAADNVNDLGIPTHRFHPAIEFMLKKCGSLSAVDCVHS
jgi:hypothetical protein